MSPYRHIATLMPQEICPHIWWRTHEGPDGRMRRECMSCRYWCWEGS